MGSISTGNTGLWLIHCAGFAAQHIARLAFSIGVDLLSIFRTNAFSIFGFEPTLTLSAEQFIICTASETVGDVADLTKISIV